jgi:hypothetical protein
MIPWQVNTAVAYGQVGMFVIYPEGEAPPGGGGSNNAVNRTFPTPQNRQWTTFTNRIFPLP